VTSWLREPSTGRLHEMPRPQAAYELRHHAARWPGTSERSTPPIADGMVPWDAATWALMAPSARSGYDASGHSKWVWIFLGDRNLIDSGQFADEGTIRIDRQRVACAG